MPEQLRPESKDLGEAATTPLNPEPCISNPFSYCKTQMNSL